MLRFVALCLASLLLGSCGDSNDGSGSSAAGGRGGAATGGRGGTQSGATGGVTSAGSGGEGAGSGATSAGMGGEGAGNLGGSGATTGGAGATTGGSGTTTGALGAHPFTPSTPTRGGTMTFTNVGASGWWPRRIEREPGDPACDYKDGTDTWGGHCCMKENTTTSSELSPFDEEMTLILKAIDVKQLAVYQPVSAERDVSWRRVTAWDSRGTTENLWFTQEGDGSPEFPGDLTQNDCVGYVMQEPVFDCGDGRDYYCPDDPGVLHEGFSGSKLVVFLGSMSFDDARVAGCDGDGQGHPGPWVAFVASELVRDGGRKWNGLCNCYSKTGSVGDGCGEINVFEVVMDDNDFSNREFASTGVRSFQAGHVGGAVCQASCDRNDFPADVEVIDACAQSAYAAGPELSVGGETDGCPVWRRPDGDRYFFILLDRPERTIQVGIVHPANIPAAARAILPEIPGNLARADVDALLGLRLPE